MGSLTLFIGALSVKGFLGAAGLLGSVAVYEKFLWLVICILMGGVAVLTGRQAFRSAAHAKALKDGPHRLGLFLSPRWLLVHRMVDVTYIPVSHIRSIENVIVRSGGPGSSGAARVRVVYVLQTVDDNAPPLATLDRPGYAVHLDCPSSPHIYDWWRDVQARRAADS